MRRTDTRRAVVATLVLGLAAGVGCKPWTVRPIEDRSSGTPSSSGRFDAAAYVASIWAARVVAAANTSASEIGPGWPADRSRSAPAVFVRGAGTVLQVDRRSRVGLALLDLAPLDGRADVALQIGPVLRGTALRDALPFIRFGDFANQIEYADVASALNARVLLEALNAVDSASLEGRTVSFRGAVKPGGTSASGLPEIVPVVLQGGAP